MSSLEPPIKRYILGKSPTHLLSDKIHTVFKGCPRTLFVDAMTKAGVLENGRITKIALDRGIVDVCEGKPLWNIVLTHGLLNKVSGLNFDRVYANQELPPRHDEPKFVGFTVIKTYFNVSSTQIGKWVDELGLREKDGLPTKKAVDLKLAEIVEMRTDPKNKKKTKKFGTWNLDEIIRMLVEAGHPLDFDYEKSLKATGKNSAVSVTSTNTAVKQFLLEFKKLYSDETTRYKCENFVSRYPKKILLMAEEAIRKPGFFTEKHFVRR